VVAKKNSTARRQKMPEIATSPPPSPKTDDAPSDPLAEPEGTSKEGSPEAGDAGGSAAADSPPKKLAESDLVYSAEQIRIPDDLARILKDFTKSVIRDGPEDLLLYSRDYFAEMHRRKREEPGVGEALGLRHLAILRSTVEDRKLVPEISLLELRQLADQAGITSVDVNAVLEILRAESDVDWRAFLIVCATLVSADLVSTILNVAELFNTRDLDTGEVGASVHVMRLALRTLKSVDSGIAQSYVDDVEEKLEEFAKTRTYMPTDDVKDAFGF
jgi:hypothetical protein